MHRSLTVLTVVALVLVSIGSATRAAAGGGGTFQSLSYVGSGGFSGAAPDATSDGSVDEFGADPGVDRAIPHTGTSRTRVPSDHVPTPAGNAVTTANTGASGFSGISHLQQRFADSGNQFSIEPPDQALCVGGGFVVEAVNLAVGVYSTTGALLTPTTSLNRFLGLPSSATRNPTTGAIISRGPFTSDPKCLYDVDTNRWFLTVLEIDQNPTGGFLGHSDLYIAVSATSDPSGSWNILKFDVTDDGTHGTPRHAGCPCFGDQPLIGADANGFYVSTNEFPIFANGFNGAQVYAMSKTALATGSLPPVVHLAPAGLAEGQAYTVQPATTPPGGAYAPDRGGTEYFLSALDFTGTLDDRIAVWALTNTSSLNGSPNVTLTSSVISSQVYGQPPDAQQKPGATPLGDTVKGKLEFLAGNDDRMNQVVWSGGRLWGAVNTVVKTPNGPTRIGIAYFVVTPTVSASGQAGGAVTQQGYVAVNQESVMFPSIGVNAAGRAVMTFTLVGPDYYPSAAYAVIGASGAGDVRIIRAGAGPEDGFTGYAAFGGSRTARWGDYSAAVADADGTIWTAVEYIPGGPRTSFANWGTDIGHVVP